MSSFVNSLQNGGNIDPNKNVFATIWDEYERVILESLVTSFGLDFIIRDQYGGDVDTILNVRKIAATPEQMHGTAPKMTYKNAENRSIYESRGIYESSKYHSDEQYKSINKQISIAKRTGQLIDSYTGKTVARNANIDLDHVVAAKEIHDDAGRVLAELNGVDLANSPDNLCPTDRSINRSMKQDNIEDYLAKWKVKQPDRQARIQTLKTKASLSDKEQKELNKLTKLEEIDPERMRRENARSRNIYEAKISQAYYTSPKFAKDVATAASKRGAQMGVRQALGFIFTEIWFCTKTEIQSIPPGSDLNKMLCAVGTGIKKGFKSAGSKYKQLISKIEEGICAGVLSSITTTLCNIFFTTAKNLVRCIRQVYASVIQAGKVLLFNPDNLMFGDRIKTTSVILTTGASVLVGTIVGEMVEKTPIGAVPIIGEIVKVFCSTLVSGLLSCTLLIFLDRSKIMNEIISALNKIPSDANNFAQIADTMEQLAAKLSNIDIELFRKETRKYSQIATQINQCHSEEELNSLLVAACEAFHIKIPWEGDFDTFMANRSNKLVFG